MALLLKTLTGHLFDKGLYNLSVFVLDKHLKPLMPCTNKRATILLSKGRARIHRRFPFTIRLVDRLLKDSIVQPIALKIDPGSKKTGIALVRINDKNHHVLHLMELQHRGDQIKKSLLDRKGHRRFRRNKLRYRAARFDNRTRPSGWLPPSLQHRVDGIASWTKRLTRYLPITNIIFELVRFDTQLMQNVNISGIGYQNGTLAGTEVREYLLEKWQRTCAYCDVKNKPLEIDHIIARTCGGSDRVSNLTLACTPCNQKKNNLPIGQFVKDKTRLSRILKQAKTPLRDAAAVNATRNALYRALLSFELPVETGTGGRTKWNRTRFGIRKSHVLDAACVGDCDAVLDWRDKKVLCIKSTGRGSYQRTRLDRYGFRRGVLMKSKSVYGYMTGDLVKAVVTKGKKIGVYIGRVAVRASGSFDIDTGRKLVEGIGYKNCKLIQRSDGYGYV